MAPGEPPYISARPARSATPLIDAEFEDGDVGVAAPVRNFSGRIVAALNVSAPAFRLGGRRLDAAGGEIRARAEELWARLGSGAPTTTEDSHD